MEVICSVCGKTFETNKGNRRQCDDCRGVVKSQNTKREPPKKEKPPEPPVVKCDPVVKMVDSWCRRCIYLGQLSSGGMKYCDYVEIERKRRPCPAGKGCTVRKFRK